MKSILILAIACVGSIASANWDDGLGYQPSQFERKHSYQPVETTTASCGSLQHQLNFWGYIYTTTNGYPKNTYTPYVADASACTYRQQAFEVTVPSSHGACDLGYRCVTK